MDRSASAIARFYRGSKVIGAGFLVEGGYLLTCAHVVRDALGAAKAQDPVGQTVKVNFPFASLNQKLDARVLLYRLEQREDAALDVAGLQLLGEIPPGIEAARPVPGHVAGLKFKAFGFPEGHPRGIYSYGELRDELPHGWVQLEDIKSQGIAIQPGFSGTAIWSLETGTVSGMAVARDKKNPEAKVAFMIPARTLAATVTALDSLSLQALLDGPELQPAVTRAYQLCCPEGYIEGSATTLGHQLRQLQEFKPDRQGHRAMDRFAALLSLSELGLESERREQLRRWLDRRVTAVNALLQQVAPLVSQLTVVKGPTAESHLLIYVKPTYQQTGTYPVKVWFIADARRYDARSGAGKEEIYLEMDTVTQATLENFVQTSLEQVVQRSPKNLMVHLILPLALMNEQVDRWSLMEEPILPGLTLTSTVGERYRLVLQIAERLHPKVLGFFEERWRQNWQALQTLTHQELRDAFLPGEAHPSPVQLKGQWQTASKLGLKLSKVLAAQQYMEVFSTLVEFGIPAALWLRSDQFVQELECGCELDSLLCCDAPQLPELVREQRGQAVTQPPDAHIGHHLSFLWEDPTLMPPRKMLEMA